jgi:hypothetical protein
MQKGYEMFLEPTPRMMINDLYRLEKERSQAHERVIQAIIHDADTTQHEQERESIKESQQGIRNRLKQEA